MFNLFGKRKVKEMIEEAKETYIVPETKKKDEPTGHTMYSIGLTDNNRVSFKMGYSEITMNPQGVQNLIDQLELFKSQIIDEDQNDQSQPEHS
jgi:hypothetical protein